MHSSSSFDSPATKKTQYLGLAVGSWGLRIESLESGAVGESCFHEFALLWGQTSGFLLELYGATKHHPRLFARWGLLFWCDCRRYWLWHSRWTRHHMDSKRIGLYAGKTFLCPVSLSLIHLFHYTLNRCSNMISSIWPASGSNHSWANKQHRSSHLRPIPIRLLWEPCWGTIWGMGTKPYPCQWWMMSGFLCTTSASMFSQIICPKVLCPPQLPLP